MGFFVGSDEGDKSKANPKMLNDLLKEKLGNSCLS